MGTATAPIETAPAAPEAAPVVEKAPAKEEKGAFGREVVIRNYEDPAAPPPPESADTPAEEGAAIDAPAVEAEEEKAPEPPKEVKLAEYRKPDGRFDEAKLEQAHATLTEVTASWSRFNALIAKHPELELDILRAVKADGNTLTPEAEAKLAAVKPPEVKPVTSPADLKAIGLDLARTHEKQFNEIRSQHGEAAANYFWMVNVTTPYQQAALDIRDADKNAKAQAETERQARAKALEFGAQRVREQVVECHKAYPTLFRLDPKLPYGGDFADADVSVEVTKLRAALGGPLTLLELTEMALVRLKRARTPQTAPPAKKVAAPVMTQRAPVKAAPVAEKGLFGRTVTVKNG